MHIASRPEQPARRRTVAALIAPIRTALRGRPCDGFDHHTFQFPQDSLDKYERAEQRRADRKLALKGALIAAILAAGTLVAYRTLPKAFENVPATLAQAEVLRGM